MKASTGALLAILFAIQLTACGGGGSSSTTGGGATPTAAKGVATTSSVSVVTAK